MIALLRILIALCVSWLAQNTTIIYDNFALYDSVFQKQFGHVTEQTFEGYELENDCYIIEFRDGNIKEIESDDLTVGDPVTVWFLEGIAIRTVYDFR